MNLELTIRISDENGEFLDTEHHIVSVDEKDVNNDDKLFTALREQCPELYEDWPDCQLEIADVEAV